MARRSRVLTLTGLAAVPCLLLFLATALAQDGPDTPSFPSEASGRHTGSSSSRKALGRADTVDGPTSENPRGSAGVRLIGNTAVERVAQRFFDAGLCHCVPYDCNLPRCISLVRPR
jgi:hypothetical protein